jgi:hypothetical protein
MSNPKKKMISLEITEELKEALRVAAFTKAVTVSALIRQTLEKEFLNADRKETPIREENR